MAQIAVPCLWIQSDAASAIRYYTALVPDSEIYSLAELPDPSGNSTVISEFRLGGVHYRAIGGAAPFALNESFSISITCSTQDEIDRYWDALTDGGVPGQCGWLVDRWGLSWQIIPARLGDLLQDANPARANAARQAMFGMSRLVIAELDAAADAAG